MVNEEIYNNVIDSLRNRLQGTIMSNPDQIQATVRNVFQDFSNDITFDTNEISVQVDEEDPTTVRISMQPRIAFRHIWIDSILDPMPTPIAQVPQLSLNQIWAEYSQK